MADYRTMFDSEHLGAWDLRGKDATVTIARVVAGKLTGSGGKTAKKPILYFEGKQKGMACNKTNCKALAAMYGTDTTAWVGKRITIYPTTTSFGSETVDCIRVRPGVPSGSAPSSPADEETPDGS